ncbi:MAG: acyltransferase family protein [Thermoguttaceae bacterium]|jgi:predicted acyltransferase
MSSAEQPSDAVSRRLVSLDAYRGANMFFIMGGTSLFSALAALWPGTPFWGWVGSQMHHAKWHGVTHHDMIFPTFLFIAGCAFPFSLARQREKGRTTCQIVRKIVIRALLLVLIGIIYNNNVRFDFANLRYASVLGHIGLAWMVAALLAMIFGVRTRVAILILILVGYWLAMRSFTATDIDPNADCWSMAGSLAGYVDRHLLPGHLYLDIHDPEGLFSTIPAIGTAMLGVFAGEWLRKGGVGARGHRKAFGLLLVGGLLIFLGSVWKHDMPLNKNLWTSSFVCFVGGFSMAGLGIFYWLIDVLRLKCWAFPFVVIGMNSITIYLAQRFFSFSQAASVLFQDAIERSPEVYRDVLNAGAYALTCWLFLFILYKYKAFIKI